MIQSDNGPFVRTMLWSNALSAANGEWGWLQNRGGEWTLTLLSPAAPLKAWVAERNAAFHFSLAFSFENARCFSLSLPLSPSLSLSLWKFARFWVWSILNIERLRMIYVAWPDGNSEQEMRAIFQLRCFFQIRLPLCNWAELRVKSYRLVWLLFASEIYSNDLNNWINFCSFPIRSPLFICSSSFLEHFLTY